MKIEELLKKIIDTLKADTTVAPVVASRIYTHTPEVVTYPFIRVNITDRLPEFTFGGDRLALLINVQCFTKETSKKTILQLPEAVLVALRSINGMEYSVDDYYSEGISGIELKATKYLYEGDNIHQANLMMKFYIGRRQIET